MTSLPLTGRLLIWLEFKVVPAVLVTGIDSRGRACDLNRFVNLLHGQRKVHAYRCSHAERYRLAFGFSEIACYR